ncbi:AAA family ATPase [Lachnospiraceae bacterium 47-T17]
MARTVGIGHQDFGDVIRKNLFYVDKTAFIKEWWENEDSVTLIMRPRRFGKTLNMSMLEYFFSVKHAGRGDLFEGLSIWQEEKYRKLQGTFPVISLSFANVKETTYSMARKKVCQMLANLYVKHSFLLESNILQETDVNYFKRVSEHMDDSDASIALYQLSDFLYRYYGKKVIILLDEYDTPMQEAYVGGYWEELAGFTRSMFNSTFKTNPYLGRAVMTGITRISKESIFSDLNHLEVVTTTSGRYEKAFGFTQQEVFAAMDEFGRTDKEAVKAWYDGFTFGDVRDIYNPWSISNYLDKGKFDTYWANTSANSLASKLLREGSIDLKRQFEVLLEGGTIRGKIDEQIVFSQLDQNGDAVWGLLLASGYLKVVSHREITDVTDAWFGGELEYELVLTNGEVRMMFGNMVRSWFARSRSDYNEFVRAMLAGDIDAMNGYMNRVALNTFSYFDTGKDASGAQPEKLYHGFVLGLLVELNGRYRLTSNRESGFGRYDVMLEPLNRKDSAIILEFKVFRPQKESALEDTVQEALKQIEEKNYEQKLVDVGIERARIRKYGFAFEGKQVLIGEG